MPFQKGVSANPGGRPAGMITWQQYAARASGLLEDYSTVELIELGSKASRGEEVNLCGRDGLIVVNIASALKSDGKERERLLDRLLGKPVQRIGGENPGEPIKLSATNGMGLESLDSDTLLAIAELIRAAKEKQTMMTIEGSATPIESPNEN